MAVDLVQTRLFQEIREKRGLVYGISFGWRPFRFVPQPRHAGRKDTSSPRLLASSTLSGGGVYVQKYIEVCMYKRVWVSMYKRA